MIKNKAIKALVVGSCLFATSVAGVYADTNTVEVKPAIVEQANEEKQEMTIQITAVQNEDALTQKQAEIDKYVFEDHKEELDKLGIYVTHTGVIGDIVEVGIRPYDQKNADYLYEIFGKDMVSVVSGEEAVPLEYVTMTVDKSAQSGMVIEEDISFFAKIINAIAEFFKNLF